MAASKCVMSQNDALLMGERAKVTWPIRSVPSQPCPTAATYLPTAEVLAK